MEVSLPLVEVLMPTFNGERHLRAQVESILAQTGVRVRLVVRDDGSEDETLSVLSEFLTDDRVVVTGGGNLGLPHVFFAMIEDSGQDADYWALSDQDDVWLPTKLSRAISRLEEVSGPAMGCARVLVTDEELVPRYPHRLPGRGVSFPNALVQNVATGCTIVLNGPARDALRGRWPEAAVMHDAWIYLVVAGVGSVIYDPAVVVLYRQHSGNAVGMGANPLARVCGRVQRQLRPGGSGAHGRQNRELERTHADLLLPEAQRELRAFLDAQETVATRARYAFTGAAHRQTVGSDLVLKGLQVLGRS